MALSGGGACPTPLVVLGPRGDYLVPRPPCCCRVPVVVVSSRGVVVVVAVACCHFGSRPERHLKKVSVTSSLSFDVQAAKNRPVSKVIVLLKDMLKQLEEEAEEDEEIYDKMACWCETNDKKRQNRSLMLKRASRI